MKKNNDKLLVKYIKSAINAKDKNALDNAFNMVYNEYSKLIKYVSYQIVRSNNDADDIVQDTFVNFLNKINKIKLVNIKYYLVTTAKNFSINLSKSYNKQIVLGYEDDIIIQSKSDNINEMISLLKKELNSEEVDIIVRHLVFNCTFKEIAKEYNVTTSSITNKYARAINKFKKKNG